MAEKSGPNHHLVARFDRLAWRHQGLEVDGHAQILERPSRLEEQAREPFLGQGGQGRRLCGSRACEAHLVDPQRHGRAGVGLVQPHAQAPATVAGERPAHVVGIDPQPVRQGVPGEAAEDPVARREHRAGEALGDHRLASGAGAHGAAGQGDILESRPMPFQQAPGRIVAPAEHGPSVAKLDPVGDLGRERPAELAQAFVKFDVARP
jgi:hypothetical protein